MPTNVLISDISNPYKASETPTEIIERVEDSRTGWIVLTGAEDGRTLGIRAEMLVRMIELTDET